MGLLNRFRSRRVVLLYHRIARVLQDPWSLCVTPEHFAEHLEVLRSYHRIRLSEIRAPCWNIGFGQLSVAMTFDDGYADNLYTAACLLRRYETPATFFIATGYIGSTREFWWDELERVVLQPAGRRGHFSCSIEGLDVQIDPDDDRRTTFLSLYEKLQPLPHEKRCDLLDRMLDWAGEPAYARPSHRCLTQEEVVQLAGNQLFEIGAHTVTHPLLSTQPLDCQYNELSASKKCLEDLLGVSVTSCSYPYGGTGHYTVDTVRLVRDIGFKRACTTNAHGMRDGDSPYEIPRFNITDMNGYEFERLLFSFPA